jgi:hypothetical protein
VFTVGLWKLHGQVELLYLTSIIRHRRKKMINEEERFNKYVEKSRPSPIKPFPVAILIRSRERMDGEPYEDYRQSMRILTKAQRLIKKFGSQHRLYYEQSTGRIIGL